MRLGSGRAGAPLAGSKAAASAMEEERDFLLRSLRDLEAEWEAGDIDEVDYLSLKDDYTARAASVLRQLAPPPTGADQTSGVEGTDEPARPELQAALASPSAKPIRLPTGARRRQRPPWARWQKAVAVVIVMALFGLAGWGLHQATSSSPSTGTVSGSQLDPTVLANELVAAQKDIDQEKYLDALKIYRTILATNPDQPEALTYQGWLLAIAGFVDQGMASLDRAEKVAPTYPDAHLFRGVILLRNKHQPAQAVRELQTYLNSHPPAAAAGMARQAIAQARSAKSKAASKPASSSSTRPG